MATNSPPPNTAPSAVPPISTTIPSPPESLSLPPTTSSPSQPTANPPDPTTPSTPSPLIAPSPQNSSPPPQNSSPPPLTSTPSSLPRQTISPTSPPPPPSNSTPPASNPPMSSTLPPSNSPLPSPPVSSPPPSSPPPPVSNPPTSSPPSPVPNPPTSSPPPVTNPPRSSPPPPSNPPPSSPPLRPPPPPSSPPPNSPPSPPSDPTTSSPPSPPPSSSPPPLPPSSSRPPPVPNPPRSSPPQVPNPPSSPPPPSNPPISSPPPRPPPSSSPSANSLPSPLSDPTTSSPPPPPSAFVPPRSPPPPEESNPPSKSSPNWSPPPPPPMIRLSPPPGVAVPSSDNKPGMGSNPSSPESSNSPSKNGIETAGAVAIAVAAGIIVLILIGLIVWCLRRRGKEISGLNGVYVMPSQMGSSLRTDSSYIKTQSSAPLIGSGSGSDFVNSPKESGGLANSRSLFTYEELIKATNGFSVQNLLGEGGFGSVYKGYLPDGREVAIKQLKIGGGQGEREFKAEVEIISRIHHRHLVSLVGYCISENQRLLIYDYVPNNALYFHLHGQLVLDWATRVKIAVGAARGIAYLHEDCDPRIIHRDIKSSNILLNDNFEARVSDFGLAKLALDANTHVTTRVMGTFGYMAPEYASSGKLTEKSDVFSFGVVLLELITGRKPVDASQPLGDESLVEWSRPLLSHALDNEEFDGLADPRLGKNYVESEMFRMIETAAACVRHSAAKRPGMGQVVRALDSLATSDLTNGMRVGESEVFNSAQQSAEIQWFRRMAFGSQNYSTDFFSQGSLYS